MAGGRKVYATIDCEKHGVADCRGMTTKRVRVAIPLTKKQRLYGGCPFCNAEAEKARKSNS